mgnify:CR=1 FL=1
MTGLAMVPLLDADLFQAEVEIEAAKTALLKGAAVPMEAWWWYLAAQVAYLRGSNAEAAGLLEPVVDVQGAEDPLGPSDGDGEDGLEPHGLHRPARGEAVVGQGLRGEHGLSALEDLLGDAPADRIGRSSMKISRSIILSRKTCKNSFLTSASTVLRLPIAILSSR